MVRRAVWNQMWSNIVTLICDHHLLVCLLVCLLLFRYFSFQTAFFLDCCRCCAALFLRSFFIYLEFNQSVVCCSCGCCWSCPCVFSFFSTFATLYDGATGGLKSNVKQHCRSDMWPPIIDLFVSFPAFSFHMTFVLDYCHFRATFYFFSCFSGIYSICRLLLLWLL